MLKLNYDPTVDSGFAAEAMEAQYFSFKYSCRVGQREEMETESDEIPGFTFPRRRRRRKRRRTVARETRALWKSGWEGTRCLTHI